MCLMERAAEGRLGCSEASLHSLDLSGDHGIKPVGLLGAWMIKDASSALV